MKSIYQLVPDIQQLLTTKGWFDELSQKSFSDAIIWRLSASFNQDQAQNKLRLSKMGPSCPRAFWYSVHEPGVAEPLPPWAEFKYSFGHIIEALVISLAKAAGHTVEGEQDEIVVDGVTGHRDCVIDGCLCDIKSQSGRAIEKLRSKSIATDDPFGYLDQLDGYSLGSIDDPLVKIKDKAFIIGVDKTLGHIVLYEHECRPERIKERIAECKRIIGNREAPACRCGTRAEGSSGNIALDVKASYSPYKYQCFPHLRTFLYERGPVYLTKVMRLPNVPEVPMHSSKIRGLS